MKNEQKAIEFFAKVTAGRYYTIAQLHRLSDLISRAVRLTPDEKAAFEAFVFDPKFAKIKSIVDHRNAYVLAVTDADDVEAEYHEVCIEVRSAVKELWYDKESWIAFANGKDKTFDNVLEGAFFAYAVGDPEPAKERFCELAEANHLMSIVTLVALYEECGERDLACEWLAVGKRIREELFRESMSEADQAALDAYLAEGRKSSYDRAFLRYVDYFDVFSFGGMQFTAGGKF